MARIVSVYSSMRKGVGGPLDSKESCWAFYSSYSSRVYRQMQSGPVSRGGPYLAKLDASEGTNMLLAINVI